MGLMWAWRQIVPLQEGWLAGPKCPKCPGRLLQPPIGTDGWANDTWLCVFSPMWSFHRVAWASVRFA
eukprot:4644037-Lingulodinium_polyedra.AAC.1